MNKMPLNPPVSASDEIGEGNDLRRQAFHIITSEIAAIAKMMKRSIAYFSLLPNGSGAHRGRDSSGIWCSPKLGFFIVAKD